MYRIAIHPDGLKKNSDYSAPYWIEYLQNKGCNIKIINAYSSDIIKQIKDCHGFMWRWFHGGHDARVAQHIIPVIDKYLGIPCFPDVATCWYYDNKISQKYIFEACDIPHPSTWYFINKADAIKWVKEEASFPLIMKLSHGAGSTGVKLLKNKSDAMQWIKLVFDNGIISLEKDPILCRIKDSIKYSLDSILRGWANHRLKNQLLSYGYILFQEFLPHNKWDTRVTVIGNRAFAFRRFNRKNDFRASGSGLIDYSISEIDPKFIRLAFEISKKLKCQSIAIDGLWKNSVPVVGEISYTFAQKAIFDAPGHWELSPSGSLIWHDGHMWPGTAQAIDFFEQLMRRAE